MDQIDARIASLEAELQQLKRQRAEQARVPLKALDGIRIVDLSRFIFGPFCTQMLADMGADVVKIEPRGTGDPARRSGNFSVNGESASFFARNRNKRSLVVDLRQPAGQEIVTRLALQSDVLIHNFRPGVMARLGLDAKKLRQRNTGLIYCSLSGYGQSGPLVKWPGQDILVQAMSGIISTTGWEGGPPVAVGTYLADVTGALTAAYGIVTALQARNRYGIGQEIEISLLDAMIALQSMEMTSFVNSGVVPPRCGSGHWMVSQPYGIFETLDGKGMALNANSEDWWGRLCKSADFAALNHDPRFATQEGRRNHGAALVEAITPIVRTKTRDEWLQHLGQYDVLCAPVYNYAEVFAHPQVQHNAMVVEQHHPTAGPIRVLGLPVKLLATPGEVGPAAPRLGEHTVQVLQELGYEAADIARLQQDNIVESLSQ